MGQSGASLSAIHIGRGDRPAFLAGTLAAGNRPRRVRK